MKIWPVYFMIFFKQKEEANCRWTDIYDGTTVGFWCLVQGHIDMWPGGTGNWTSDPTVHWWLLYNIWNRKSPGLSCLHLNLPKMDFLQEYSKNICFAFVSGQRTMSLFTVMVNNADQSGQKFFLTIVEFSDLQDINCVWQWIDERSTVLGWEIIKLWSGRWILCTHIFTETSCTGLYPYLFCGKFMCMRLCWPAGSAADVFMVNFYYRDPQW